MTVPLKETFNTPLPEADEETPESIGRVCYSKSDDPGEKDGVLERSEAEYHKTRF